MSTAHEVRALARVRPLQTAALAFFLAVIGGIAFQLKYCVLDYDIWWHLKVGDWIVQHAAVPHLGILSRTAGQRPWVAYSWGYELLLSLAYRWFGLLGVAVFGVLLTIGIALSLFWMLRRLSGKFWIALALAAVASSAFLFNGMPRPFFFSIMLFCITLTLLLEANRSGRVEPLYWLVPIFAIWANLHIQFVYGLFVVGLLVAVTVALEIGDALGLRVSILMPCRLPARPLLLIFSLCFAATLVGPNFYHPYVAVYEYSKAKFSYSIILELQPLSFRGSSHFAQLLLTAFAFFAVGWRQKIDAFKLALLTVCSIVAFRTMRDAWFICLPAAACIADFPSNSGAEDEDAPATAWEWAGTLAASVLLLLLAASALRFNERNLDHTISANYPVDAINFLRRHPQPGPLYNNLNWGGFLMWYMPDHPVAIDGRNDLYGDDLDRVFYQSENADDSYLKDPYLNEAGIVLLDSAVPLAKVLTVDPRFTMVYQDPIAVVFARR